jgi:tRNA threonylcarbamoyladenosine dehydratase
MSRHPARFDRIARLLGLPAMERLARSHVAVFGMGGVGSFAAEALARSGVGRLTLVDGERICETNVNRQLHALDGALGRFKVDAMAERLRLIAPASLVEERAEFYDEASSARLLAPDLDFVVDAIDTVVPKLHLLATCVSRSLPVVSAMGAARRLDPTAVRLSELCDSHTDQFAKDVRKYLRTRHGIQSDAPNGILAVWSAEPARPALELPGDQAGIPGVLERTAEEKAQKRRPKKSHGSAAFVTGAFGLAAAAAVVRALTGEAPLPSPPGRDRPRRRAKSV